MCLGARCRQFPLGFVALGVRGCTILKCHSLGGRFGALACTPTMRGCFLGARHAGQGRARCSLIKSRCTLLRSLVYEGTPLSLAWICFARRLARPAQASSTMCQACHACSGCVAAKGACENSAPIEAWRPRSAFRAALYFQD